ncbi:hypothetical protein Taro_043568 [Colocasia esculenta]|uniref:Uncharacterized protein n=1 Tax=Colocasia esculenta TaxID=4460 RepID=A0A843X4A3_COLES|nr:hypothetical protein [Colocasia esculenta]
MVWVSEVVEALFRCGPASPSHCLVLRWFRSRVGRSGVGPQLGRAAVPCLAPWAWLVWPRGPCLVVSALRVLSGCLVRAPNCCFGNPFLGAVRGGTGVCSSLTSWCVRGAGWFCLWALDLVEVCGGRACGETVLLTWLLGVSRGDTWFSLPNLVEVQDVGACVVRLWSHVVAVVFRELLCLGGSRVWPDPGCGSWRYSVPLLCSTMQ